jgi:zinc protease
MSKQQSFLDAGQPDANLLEALAEESFRRYHLENGLTVLLRPDRSLALCSAQVWVKSGSIHEEGSLGSGLSHFLEHMLFKGTEKREGREISECVQEAGGYINAYTTFDRTVYYIDIPSENVEVALDVLSDAVFKSTLPPDEIEKERDVILREIDMGEDDPDRKLLRALFETAFRTHPFRYPIIGYKDLFAKVSRDELVAYYERRYIPNNSVLVVSGDFDVQNMKELVDRFFGELARRPLPNIFTAPEPRQLAFRSKALYEDVQIVRVAMGFQTPGLSHPDTPVLDALSLILGHGYSSLLSVRLREKLKLVHTIDASNWTPGELGVFYLALICDPDKRQEALDETKRYLQSLTASDFTEERIRKAVRQLMVSEINARKTVSGQASKLAAAEVVVGDIRYAEKYLRKAMRVTADDLVRVLNDWLLEERMTIVSLNPKGLESADAQVADWQGSDPDFETREQANGSSLLARRDNRLPNAHIRVVLNGGSLLEDAGKQGSTSLLATLFTKDTEKRTASEVAQAVESAGASFYEFAGNNSLGLGIDFLPTDIDLALDILEQALLHSRFDEETFSIEKEAHLAAIKEDLDDIVIAGRRELRKLFFGEHPFQLGGSGSLATVEPLTIGDLVALRERLLLSGNVTLAISGMFDTETIIPRLESLMAKLPQGEKPKGVFPFEKPDAPGVHRSPMDRQQAVVYHAYPGPGLLDDDFHVSEVADELFSGMSSHLFERVRENLGLAYFVRSSRIVGLDTAMFYLYAGTSQQGYDRVIAELVGEVERVRAGKIADEELARCQSRLKAARRMGLQTNASCSSHAAMNVAYGLPANDGTEYDRKIDSVSKADLARFADRYFKESSRIELVVGAV